jgi:PadR family transcriptional regulator PadR
MRTTDALVKVATALMHNPHTKQWGYSLSRASGVRSGVLYPILARLLDRGWLEDGWEDPSAITEKRPPRRYYTVTEEGLRELGAVVARASADTHYQNQVGTWQRATA